MGKSKKKKNRDFQKVKLKVGKEKRSGTETNLSFKTRTIKVPQTLKDFSSTSQVPHTKKKLTLQDLLSRCDVNKSRSQRLSAVEGLQEMTLDAESCTASFWTKHFRTLMPKLASLFCDPEPVVRQGVVRLCRTVFPLVGEAGIQMDIFSAHLVYAMGHVSDDIRRDALALFDLLVDNCPGKLMDASCRLVPALINQISSFVVQSNRVAHRTLAVNPRSKLSSQKWRAEMLLRLKKILEVYVNKHRTDTTRPPENDGEVYHFGIDYPVIRLGCFPPRWKRLWTQWPKSVPLNQQEYDNLTRDSKQLQKLVTSLLPLIKECWREEFAAEDSLGPSHSHSAADSHRPLTQDSLPMVKAVVDLLFSFVECWRCVYSYCLAPGRFDCTRWFSSEFLRELREMLLPHFPIVVMEKPVKGRKGRQLKGQQLETPSEDDLSGELSPLQVSVLKLNLTVSEMLASFPPSKDWPHSWVEPQEWQGEVVAFLLKNLKRSIKVGFLTRVGKILHEVFFNYPYTDQLGRLLARIQKRFVSAHPLSQEKLVLLELLDEMSFEVDEKSPYNAGLARICDSHIRHSLLESFLQALPMLVLELCEMEEPERVEQIAVRTLKAMCHQYSPVLSEAVRRHLPRLLDDRTGVFAKLPKSCHENMYLAHKRAYHYITYPKSILKQLELIIRHPNVENALCYQICMSVNHTYDTQMSRARGTDMALMQALEDCRTDYLSFHFSVVVGHSLAELEAMDTANTAETGLMRVLWTCSMEQFAKHLRVVKGNFNIFDSYLRTNQPDMSIIGVYAMDVMGDVWNVKILAKYSSLSVITVWSALSHWWFLMGMLARGQDFHIDNAPSPAGWVPVEKWYERVRQVLPVFKARLRPFTRLAFALLYSMVAMETGVGREEGAGLPPEGMVQEMWVLVVGLMNQSLRMLLDLLQVMTSFVQEEQTERESMRTTLALKQLLADPNLHCHRDYCHLFRPHLATYLAGVKAVTPRVEGCQWWQDFVAACDQLGVRQELQHTDQN
ncbi:testis-expressed protein 10 homolog [Babylonia areolata]|uniref:testis-expressed protein 10 homolog n=1 Tax=Babylonia areolata TaxID=304850 RepID=UPI003FCF12FD